MPSTESELGAFTRRIEEQGYIAYREWPVFLALREAQLKQLLSSSPQPSRMSQASAATMKKPSEKKA